jgi:hypothetical protein
MHLADSSMKKQEVYVLSLQVNIIYLLIKLLLH